MRLRKRKLSDAEVVVQKFKKQKPDVKTEATKSNESPPEESKTWEDFRKPGADFPDLSKVKYLGSKYTSKWKLEIVKVHILGKDGWGVVAGQDIPAKEIIEAYIGKETILKTKADLSSDSNDSDSASNSGSDEDAETNTPMDTKADVIPTENLKTYGMEVEGVLIDAEYEGNITRCFNHSSFNNNVSFDKNPKEGHSEPKIIVRTIKPIKKGENLLVNYEVYNPNSNFYFFNPIDPNESLNEFLLLNRDCYQLKTITKNYPGLDLTRNESIYVTSMGALILDNKDLAIQNFSDEEIKAINFRFIKTKDEKALELNEYDSCTAVMLAAYLGQTNNLKWLLSKGAYNDAQQTLSGQTAFFMALKGFADKKCSEKKCVDTLIALIENKANIHTQNKQEQIFLELAIKQLSSKSLTSIVKAIKKYNNPDIYKLPQSINKVFEDFVYLLIKHKQLDTLEVYFSYFREYPKKYIGDGKYYKIDEIKNGLIDYNPEEKIQLQNIFLKYHLDQSIVDQIMSDKEVEKKIETKSITEKMKEKPKQQELKHFDQKPSINNESKQQTNTAKRKYKRH